MHGKAFGCWEWYIDIACIRVQTVQGSVGGLNGKGEELPRWQSRNIVCEIPWY